MESRVVGAVVKDRCQWILSNVMLPMKLVSVSCLNHCVIPIAKRDQGKTWTDFDKGPVKLDWVGLGWGGGVAKGEFFKTLLGGKTRLTRIGATAWSRNSTPRVKVHPSGKGGRLWPA